MTLRSKVTWSAAGQVMTAAGILAGLRLQTEHIEPAAFGAAMLASGYSALCVGIVASAYAQAALRYLPEAELRSGATALQYYLRTLVTKRLLAFVAFTALAATPYCVYTGTPYSLIVALCALCMVDTWRTVELALLNAAQQQRPYALWTIFEAFARPALAVTVVILVGGASATGIVAAYATASALPLLWRFGAAENRGSARRLRGAAGAYAAGIHAYARPLVPLGALGVAGSIADRYVVGATLGLQQAGVYSALSGLISRPFLLTQAALELVFRPIYFSAIARRDSAATKSAYGTWLAANAACAAVLLALFALFHDGIASLLLGSRYSSQHGLIPYIALAQFFVVIGYGFNGYLYGHGHTRLITIMTSAGSLLTIALLLGFGHLWQQRGIVMGLATGAGILALALGMAVRHLMKQAPR